MAAATYYSAVQKAYIAFYGRPADQVGLEYWAGQLDKANGNLATIINAFGTSAEAKALYGSKSNLEAIEAVYVQIFGRSADAEGLKYYGAELAAGRMTLVDIAQRIADGAKGADATIITNKLTAAQAFTDAMDTSAEILAYSGDAAAATVRAWLGGVTAEAASVTTATSAIAGALTGLVAAKAAAGNPGSTFTLQTTTDNVVGTVNDDVINASLAGSAGTTMTYSPVDQIAAGAGRDSLYVEANADVNLTTQTGLEVVQVNARGAAVAVTLASDKAYTKLETISSNNNVTFNSIAKGTVEAGMTSNTGNLTLNYASTALSGSADNLTVTLNNAAGTLAITGGTASNALETVTLNGVGESTIANLDVGSANTSKLVITGAAKTTVTATTDTSNTLNTIDASAATGAVSVTAPNATASTVTGGAGNDTISGAAGNDVLSGGAGADSISGAAGNDNISGGAGNDTVVVTGSDVTKNDTIDGGDGTDTLTLSGTIAYTAASTGVEEANSGSGVKGFEVLKSGGAITQDMRALSANNTITSLSVGAHAVALTKDSAINAVTFTGNGSVSMESAVEQTVTLAGGTSAAPTFVTGATVTTKATKVNVVSSGSDGVTDRNTATIAGDTVATLVVSGSERITLTASGKGVTSADFSAVTADEIGFSASAATGAITFTPGTGKVISLTTGAGADKVTLTAKADTVTTTGDGADTITAGDGNDTITASGAGNDVIDLGAGDDTVTDSGTGNDSITGGDGNDTVTTAGAGDDTVDGGAGDDNITGGAGNDSLVGGAGNDTISDGDGNDTVLGGDGNDTLTIGAGFDSVDGGAGNDSITITGLGVGDTINGGDGVDTMTVTNSSAASLTPSFTSIESLVVRTSTNFSLDLTDATDKTSLKTYNISSTSGTPADAISLTNIASGSTVTVSDDATTDLGASTDDTGDIGAVTIDTVGAATLTVTVAANADGVNQVGTATGAFTVTDANSLTINTSGGASSNRITHSFVNLVLDDTDTASVNIAASANAGLTAGNVTNAAAVETLTFSSGSNAQSSIGTIDVATGLKTLSVTSTGTDSSATVGAIGGGVGGTSQLTSITASSASGSSTTLGAITATAGSGATLVSATATGANATTKIGNIDLGTRTLAQLTLTAESNSTLGGTTANANSTITSGAVAASTVTLNDYSSVTDGDGNANQIIITGAQTALTMTIGRSVTFADDLSFTGAVTKLNLTTNTAAETVVWDATNDLNVAGGTVDVVFGDTAALVVETNITHNGTGTINYAGTFVGKSNVTGNIGNDTLLGGGGADTLNGGIGADTISGAAGNDSLTAGEGQDTILGGTGADTIVLTETTAAPDTVQVVAGDSPATIAGTGTSGTITGYDSVTGFNAGVTAAAKDLLDLHGTAVLATAATVDGTNSTLLLNTGVAVKSHKIASGIVTFDDEDTWAAAVSLASQADVAAVVQYLAGVDLGDGGETVAFTATIGGSARTFVYSQTGAAAGTYSLVELVGVTATALEVTASVTANSLFIG